MLIHFIPAVILTFLASADPQFSSPDNSPPPEYTGYKLVWADEFNVEGPPVSANWVHEQGFVRNNEAQWYQPQNAVCKGGLLVIEARRQKRDNPGYDPAAPASDWKHNRKSAAYTSSSIKTMGKHAWKFGRFEMRARFDTSAGLWPAFWTVGTPEKDAIVRPWPACGELDIMEYFNGTLLANAAWASPKPGAAVWDDSKTPLAKIASEQDYGTGSAAMKAWSKHFHYWRMDWDETKITFYVDGRELNSVDLTKTINETPDKANPFHLPHHIILNLAIGGTSGGDPAGTEFPKSFEVDWVRVYQRPTAETATPVRQKTQREIDQVRAFSGIRLRQNPEGVVIGSVQPGPFGGDGYKSPSVWRGDFVVSINDKPADPAGFPALMKSLKPGDDLKIVYRRSAKADPYAAVPTGDPAGVENSVTVKLENALEWMGTLGEGLGARTIADVTDGEFEKQLLTAADDLAIRKEPGGVDAQLAYFAKVQDSMIDPNSVAAVVQAFRRPLSLDAVEAGINSDIRAIAGAGEDLATIVTAVGTMVSKTLDVASSSASGSPTKRATRQTAIGLIRALRDNVTPTGPDLKEQLAFIRNAATLAIPQSARVPQVATMIGTLQTFAATAVTPQGARVPPELKDRVNAAAKGEVLAAQLVGDQLWIVGGQGANTYDMSRISAVFETGGDDVYNYPVVFEGDTQIIIDVAGNDRYESFADSAGPATGFFGVSVIDDRAGNDTYISKFQCSIGAGVCGVGLLIDRAGDDRYENSGTGAGWSQGVGFYGAGIILDRNGNDTYLGEKLAQGIGGPRGLGVIIDARGTDNYKANGPSFKSVYGTAGIFVGMSQGYGYGIRGYASGGVGAIYDFDGDDKYDVGEFGQGCGYFQGLGILHDHAGNDIYLGQRYAQGTGAHQAAGILVDDGGNDSYSCPGPAGQAAAWDQTVAMLIDRAGDDTYTAGGLAQGSAAQQAIGILIDLDGLDNYKAGGQAQGQGGDNTYHYDADKMFSFSALFDLGGMTDTYSTKRENSQRQKTGQKKDAAPATSDLFGLFVDQ